MLKREGGGRKANHPVHPILLIMLVLIIPVILPLINAVTGGYSTTSPFSCGANCNNGYELSGYNATYCYNNAVYCYNTIDTCRDGSNYNFEFVNNMCVESLNGSNFTGGYRINVTVEVDCDSDGDTMTISYHNGSAFRVIQDDTCSVAAMVNKTYSFVLDNIAGNHTVRAVIVYNGGTQMLCGYNYDSTFSDTDDVTFYVNQGQDTTNPKVTDVSPGSGTAFNQSYGMIVVISANITDNYNISTAQALIEWGSYNQTLNLSLVSGNNYSANLTNITELTRYNVTITANDTSGNSNNTETTYFTINSTTNITITSPTNRQVLQYGDVNLRFTIEAGYNTDTVMYSIDGGANTTVTDKLSPGFNQSDQNGTIGEADSAYANLSMSFIPDENLSTDSVALRLRRNGSGTAGSQIQVRTDSGGSPSNTILATGNITNSSVSTSYSFVNLTLNITVNLTENTTYWLFLTPNGSATDFYTWEASNDGLYGNGNYSNNASLDLLFIVYDKYKYNTTLTNVSKGTHEIIIYANSTTMSDIKSQLTHFRIDNTAPNIRTVNYNPNTTAGMDPNLVINVSTNITDQLVISQVLLQYKQSNASTFTNTSTQNISGLYKGNFTPTQQNNWTFRVYAIDNSNNTAYSSNITVNVSYEYSWNITPTYINTTSAFLNNNVSVENITFNNTADINLTFNISKTSATVPDIYFNNTEGSLVFNVSPGNTVVIEVIATGRGIELEQEIGLSLDPMQPNAIPDSRSINFTFISYVSGPYLDVDITEYDSSVTQGQARVKLTATIINVGNESANNVSVNWGLPNNWNPKTNLTANYTTLGVGQQVSFTRYVDIGSNAATGSQTIQINVNCSEGEDDYDQRSVTVVSSGSPGQTPPGSGGGGGGYFPKKVVNLDIIMVGEVELERGTSYQSYVLLNNTGDYDLENISISLEGFSSIHYKVTPNTMSKLESNSSKYVNLHIDIPGYFSGGKHQTSLVVNAFVDNAWKEFRKDLMIVVLTEDKEEASECFEKAKEKLDQLESTGINTAVLNQKLIEARKDYNTKDYVSANNKCRSIIKEAELALKLRKKIDIIGQTYNELEKDIPELAELIELARDAFEREDYMLASKRTEEAEFLVNLKEKEIQQALSYRWLSIRKNLVQIVSAIIILIIIGVFVHSSRNLNIVTRKINALEGRKEGVKDKIKETQKKYFVRKQMSRRAYSKEMGYHRRSLAEIEKKKHDLKLKRLKIIKGRNLNDLQKGKKEAEEHRKELHKKYYIEKSIDKKTFKSLNSNLDRIIEDFERRIGLKKKAGKASKIAKNRRVKRK